VLHRNLAFWVLIWRLKLHAPRQVTKRAIETARPCTKLLLFVSIQHGHALFAANVARTLILAITFGLIDKTRVTSLVVDQRVSLELVPAQEVASWHRWPLMGIPNGAPFRNDWSAICVRSNSSAITTGRTLRSCIFAL
jgi:hypothetical protein